MEFFATDSQYHNLLIGISRDPNNCLKIKVYFSYPQLWITLFVTTLIFL
jgi:hypothetical protein